MRYINNKISNYHLKNKYRQLFYHNGFKKTNHVINLLEYSTILIKFIR